MALKLGRVAKFAESLMVDQCLIRRYGRQEDGVAARRNETTGEYDAPGRVGTPNVVYEGKCMLYTRRVDAMDKSEGGEDVSAVQLYASLPRDVAWPLLPEDELVVVGVGPESDDSLIGKEFLLEAIDQGTYIATRELALTDLSKVKRT